MISAKVASSQGLSAKGRIHVDLPETKYFDIGRVEEEKKEPFELQVWQMKPAHVVGYRKDY
jgi:hypothetical protein